MALQKYKVHHDYLIQYCTYKKVWLFFWIFTWNRTQKKQHSEYSESLDIHQISAISEL